MGTCEVVVVVVVEGGGWEVVVVRVWRWDGVAVCEGERVLMGGGRGWWVEAQVLTQAAEVDWRRRGKASHTYTCTLYMYVHRSP